MFHVSLVFLGENVKGFFRNEMEMILDCISNVAGFNPGSGLRGIRKDGWFASHFDVSRFPCGF